MENTLENKAKFFAQYWGQPVGVKKIYNNMSYVMNAYAVETVDYIELKAISQITDEDLRAIGFDFNDGKFPKVKITPNGHEHYRGGIFTWGYFNLKDFDYLRSKGYALPYIDLSVEQQVEYGWVKLKTE